MNKKEKNQTDAKLDKITVLLSFFPSEQGQNGKWADRKTCDDSWRLAMIPCPIYICPRWHYNFLLATPEFSFLFSFFLNHVPYLLLLVSTKNLKLIFLKSHLYNFNKMMCQYTISPRIFKQLEGNRQDFMELGHGQHNLTAEIFITCLVV